MSDINISDFTIERRDFHTGNQKVGRNRSIIRFATANNRTAERVLTIQERVRELRECVLELVFRCLSIGFCGR
jgi:hypothetical protein